MQLGRALVTATLLTSATLPWHPPPAQAVELFRCGSHRVLIGEHISEVLDRCGEPDFADERIVRRTHTRKSCGKIIEERTVEVLVNDWVYDFGLNHYVRYLHFENNFLTSMHSRWVGAR
jgi:hypothetical protein